MPNNHGGKRDNAGKKSWNHPSKRNKNQPVLGNFFSNSEDNSSQNRNNRSRSRSVPPRQQSSSSSTRRRAQSTPRQRQPIVSEFTHVPNHDVGDMNDEEFQKGKKISKSENLSEQRNSIMKDTYRQTAFKKIRDEGIFWDHPPSLIVKPLQLKSCWKEFFKLPVFNWMPEAILGSGWKPHCPNCKKTLSRNGVKLHPRLIFGRKRNYWLNAPQRYICKDCKDLKKTHNFYDTTDDILKQIETAHPELMNIFPCILTNRNGIDKGLMDWIIHCAVKGIGPAAIADIMASLHELEWQKGENLWAKTVHTKLNQPAATQQPINRHDIEKCPDYFSLRMGGCVPSETWMIEMFCKVVNRLRPYLDSECIKRAKSSRVLSIDASYKIIKWMMTHGQNERVYNALITASNEYNEIPMQCFATSDNHEEIGANLEALKAHGLNPYLAFSDNPARDEPLLKRIFPNLNNSSGDTVSSDDVPTDLIELTSEKSILYLHQYDKLLISLSKFRQDLENALENTVANEVRVAFDTEWPLYANDGTNQEKTTRGDINIITIGSNVVDYTLIIELYNFTNSKHHMQCIGQKLQAIFSLKVACFTGCNHLSDYTLLRKQYPMFNLPDEAIPLMADVSNMAINREVVARGKGTSTLQALCRVEGRYIRKPANVRVGEVFASRNGSLSIEAQKYCQMDVEAPLFLYPIYKGIPDYTKRITAEDPSLGASVDIMPALSTATRPIAQGIIKQKGGIYYFFPPAPDCIAPLTY